MNNADQETLARHEEWLRQIMTKAMVDTESGMRASAESMALFESLCALVDHLGLDRVEFVKGHERRKAYWLDLFLRGAESVSPGLGALLDTRSPEEVSDQTDAEGFPGGMPPDLSPENWKG